MTKVLTKTVHPTEITYGEGNTYHLHIPAGTDLSKIAPNSLVDHRGMTNIVTTIQKTTSITLDVGNRIGRDWNMTTGDEVYGASIGNNEIYWLDPATADFDCDFILQGMILAGDPMLQFITARRVLSSGTKVLTK